MSAVPEALQAHWRAWVGAGDGEVERLGTDGPAEVVVVGAPMRAEPGWDGAVHPVVGVADPFGGAVVSMPPEHAAWAQDLVAGGADLDGLRRALPSRLGCPRHVVYRAVCRWAVAVPDAAALPDVGEWLPATHPEVPEWLHPFGGHVLVVLEDGRYLAGLGLKHHAGRGREISVGTDEAARGRGLARRLVAQAARSLLADGVVPTYLHAPDNAASARVADAAGFPDRGWTVLGLAGRD